MQMRAQDVQPLLEAIAVGIVLVNSDGIVCNANTNAQRILQHNPLGLSWDTICTSYPQLQFKTASLDDQQLITLDQQLGADSNVNTIGRMMASLAHQIKTPLSTALLYAQLLLDKTLPQPKIDNYIVKVNERLRNVLQIIDSLMILIKGVTPLPMAVSTANIKEDLLQYIRDKKLYVDFECLILDTVIGEPQINCDVKTLVSGIGNLINNSIEATTSLAKILILLSCADGWLHIMVSDKGPGISAHYKNNLFEPFVSTKITGTGLGLAILQIIVKSYHGIVALESDHSSGTKVIIKLPLSN